ncbi:MAG: hypothetical protein ABI406_12885 [Ktedonobacteraceae bacterium]
MPLKNGGLWEESFFHELLTLPLPGAAVVIDVRDERYCDDHDTPLIEYLAIELEDLAAEMKLNQVPRWRHLADCIEFLRIEETPHKTEKFEFLSPEDTQMHAVRDDHVDFKLTTRVGKQIPIQGREDLAKTIGRDYIDRVRNQFINAIKDTGADEQQLNMPHVDPEQPTVRVFFLTDMEDKGSLVRASEYAQWLKVWMDQQHGIRTFSRAHRISTVAICMNAPANGQEELLQELGGPLWSAWPRSALMPYTALDMVILVQTYRDDGAYIGGETQIYQVELILYTLILHWPELFTKTDWETRDDPDGKQLLPWPTYTIGISALEYSARWVARWLDYGLTNKALELMRDAGKVDREALVLRSSVRHWLNEWWQAVQAAVPTVLYGVVPGIDGLDRLQSLARSSPFRSGSLRRAQGEFQHFSGEVRQLYASSGSVTLQRTLDNAPFMLDFVKQRTSNPDYKSVEMQQTSAQLTELDIRVQRFVDVCFQGAWGAIPRARNQIAALRESTDEIRRLQQNPPNIDTMRKQIEFEIADADKHLGGKMRTWKLPFPGEALQSTIISLFVVFILAIILGFVLTNASFVPAILKKPFFLSLIWLYPLCLLFAVTVETGYLLLRNRTLRLGQQAVFQKLRVTLNNHADTVSAVVAANAALSLLESADLYKPGEETSPYEERLKQLDKVLENAQLAALHQQMSAQRRLHLGLNQKPLKHALLPTWPNLNNRKDLLTWRPIEDAYLAACKKLETSFPPLNTLSEMLVRRLGVEKSETILQNLLPEVAMQRSFTDKTVQSLLEKQSSGSLSGLNDEARFLALSTMLVSVLLSSDIVPPAIQDVQPLINRYTQQQDLLLPEPSLLGSEVLDLDDVVREAMVFQELNGHQGLTNQTWKRDIPAEFVLTAWMKQQSLFDLAFVERLEENDVIARLTQNETTIVDALEHLRDTARLAGYRDIATGDDHFYLLLAPGAMSSAFVMARERDRKIAPILFPDAEKLVYLHIHRLRQLLPVSSLIMK